jgi:hypothetical protein
LSLFDVKGFLPEDFQAATRAVYIQNADKADDKNKYKQGPIKIEE